MRVMSDLRRRREGGEGGGGGAAFGVVHAAVTVFSVC